MEIAVEYGATLGAEGSVAHLWFVTADGDDVGQPFLRNEDAENAAEIVRQCLREEAEVT